VKAEAEAAEPQPAVTGIDSCGHESIHSSPATVAYTFVKPHPDPLPPGATERPYFRMGAFT
jgi:hypothetical protein